MARQLRLGDVPPIYCIDASALVDLKRWYPQEMRTFKPIWEQIESMVNATRLISPLAVEKEIMEGKDAIAAWCKQNKVMFKDIDECQIQEIHNVQGKYDIDYWNNETNKLGHWGDPWVIALGICEDTTIVTNENKDKANRIPQIARNFNLRSLHLLEFFQEIGIE